MATIRPFHALRYDEAVAGDLDSLVAPPYDVIGADQREALLEKSPYNVVHLTLPDSEEEAAAQLADWRARGVLVEERRARTTGGSRKTTRGRTACADAARGLSPHFGSSRTRTASSSRTSSRMPGRRRGACVCCARRARSSSRSSSSGTARSTSTGSASRISQSGGDSLWRLDPEFGEALTAELADAQLLIADGHHRYETTLAAGEEWLLAVIVPTEQEGLTIFPTHRLAQSIDGVSGEPISPPGDVLPGPVLYRGGRYELLHGDGLDPEVVAALAPEGVTYTPYRDEAVAAVDRGDAAAAFLLRPTRIEDVWAVAQRGDVMPQKSTFFYPKLTSGLLMLPLDD